MRCNESEIVAGPCHADIKQAAFLFQLGRRSRPQIRGHTAVNDVEHVNGAPFLTFGGMNGGKDEIVLIKKRHASLIARCIRWIKRKLGESVHGSDSRWRSVQLNQIRLACIVVFMKTFKMGLVPDARQADFSWPTAFGFS